MTDRARSSAPARAVIRRIIGALLLGGGVIAVTWVSAPAQPRENPVPIPAAGTSSIEASAQLAHDISQQTKHLRSWMSGRPATPDPGRDPFTFAAQLSTEPAALTSPPTSPVYRRAIPAAVEQNASWPTLAAIVTNPASGVPSRTAVVAWGDHIEFVKPGETFGDFVAVAILPASISLRHVPTGSLHIIRLR